MNVAVFVYLRVAVVTVYKHCITLNMFVCIFKGVILVHKFELLLLLYINTV